MSGAGGLGTAGQTQVVFKRYSAAEIIAGLVDLLGLQAFLLVIALCALSALLLAAISVRLVRNQR